MVLGSGDSLNVLKSLEACTCLFPVAERRYMSNEPSSIWNTTGLCTPFTDTFG